MSVIAIDPDLHQQIAHAAKRIERLPDGQSVTLYLSSRRNIVGFDRHFVPTLSSDWIGNYTNTNKPVELTEDVAQVLAEREKRRQDGWKRRAA